MLISYHSLPVCHVALLRVLRAGSHLPRAAVLLVERILTMVCHGARLAEIYLMLMGELLPMVVLLLVGHGMG